MRHRIVWGLGCLTVLASMNTWAAINLQVSVSPSQPAPVGTVTRWSAVATDTQAGAIEYRYEVRPPSANFIVVRDFYAAGDHEWVPTIREGLYEIRVTARNRTTGQTAQVTQNYQVTSRVVANNPVVSPTDNPLVALYSAPGCFGGQEIRVRYRAIGAINWIYTDFRPCTVLFSYNIYIAGLIPSTTYSMQHEIRNGLRSTFGPVRFFTAGGLPTELAFPIYNVPQPINIFSSNTDSFLLHGHLTANPQNISFPVATDVAGLVRWFYPKLANDNQIGFFLTRPVEGGTILLIVNDELTSGAPEGKNQILREIDLAGNTVRETNATTVADQLEAMGKTRITSFHHEAFRMPTPGHTMVLASVERILVDKQGPGPVNVVGDALVELDENMRVVWYWDGFDHLDQTKPPVLGEVCQSAGPGCPPLFNGPSAVDWTHANSVAYVPGDGSLIMSIRHFDWVVKINYANRTGDGRVLWRLGKDGDFTFISNDPWPWFSHQHDAEYEPNGLLSLYDNSNTRRAQFDPNANSRGQALLVNELTRTATLLVNADLGVYAAAVGSAERLSNGNYSFCSGFLNGTASNLETLQSGVPVYEHTAGRATYRSFRMSSLYQSR